MGYHSTHVKALFFAEALFLYERASNVWEPFSPALQTFCVGETVKGHLDVWRLFFVICSLAPNQMPKVLLVYYLGCRLAIT